MERNFVLETSCHRKIYSHRRKFPITGRYFLSNNEVSSHRKKFSVIGRYLLSQEEILSTGRHLLSQEEIYCHRKKFPVTGRNFSSLYPILCLILICIRNAATFIIIYTYDQELLYFGSNTSSPGKSCQEGKTILPSCVYLRPIYYMSNAYLR